MTYISNSYMKCTLPLQNEIHNRTIEMIFTINLLIFFSHPCISHTVQSQNSPIKMTARESVSSFSGFYIILAKGKTMIF
jgi:hypothetical protein